MEIVRDNTVLFQNWAKWSHVIAPIADNVTSADEKVAVAAAPRTGFVGVCGGDGVGAARNN